MTKCTQAAFQLCYLKEHVDKKEMPADNLARSLKLMFSVWLKCLPREYFDIFFYEKLTDGSFNPHSGIILYSSLGNGFIFSVSGQIFWYECQEYQMTEKLDGSFVCPKLNLFEISIYAEEIIEALSSANPEISHHYSTNLQHNQTT